MVLWVYEVVVQGYVWLFVDYYCFVVVIYGVQVYFDLCVRVFQFGVGFYEVIGFVCGMGYWFFVEQEVVQ